MKPRIRRIIIVKLMRAGGQWRWLACRLTESRDVKLVSDAIAAGQKIACIQWGNKRPGAVFKIFAFFDKENYLSFEAIDNFLFDGSRWRFLNDEGPAALHFNDFIERAEAENRLLKALPPPILSTLY